MIGPVVNAAAIIVCSLAGKFLFRNVPAGIEEIVFKAIGIAVIYIGITGAMVNKDVLLLIVSLIAGSIIGELIGIDKGMNKLGKWAESRLGAGDGNFSKGFVTATIIYCVGSMAIVGSLQSGLSGNHEMLFAKSILDGIVSVILASQMGLGVLFSFVPVLLYEGSITLGAMFVKDWLTPEIINEMSAAGNLLIAVIGFNFMGVKEIKVANMVPAIFIPWVYLGVCGLFT